MLLVEDLGYIVVESLGKPSPTENRNVSSERIDLTKAISRLTVESDNQFLLHACHKMKIKRSELKKKLFYFSSRCGAHKMFESEMFENKIHPQYLREEDPQK